MPGYPAPGYRAPRSDLMGPVAYGTSPGTRGFKGYAGTGATSSSRFWNDPSPVPGSQQAYSGIVQTGMSGFLGAHLVRPATMATAKALQSADGFVSGMLNRLGDALHGPIAASRFNSAAFDKMAASALENAKIARNMYMYGANAPLAPSGPFGRAGTSTGMDILRRILEDKGGFLRPGRVKADLASLLSVFDARLIAAFVIQDLLKMWLMSALSGMNRRSRGGYVLDPGNFTVVYRYPECTRDHSNVGGLLYYPAFEQITIQNTTFPTGAQPHHRFILPDDGKHVEVLVASYAYSELGEVAYPAATYDALDVLERPATGPVVFPKITEKWAPSGFVPGDPREIDLPGRYRWANPWPALDPFLDPRTAPGGYPLDFPARAVPIRLIPYRVVNPYRVEQSSWGPERVPYVPATRPDPDDPRTWPDLPPGKPGQENPPLAGPPEKGNPPDKKPRGVPEAVKAALGGRLTLAGTKLLIAKAFSAVTELGDLADCAYGSVPAAARIRFRPGNPITMDEKAAVAAKNFAAGNFDAGAFISCVAKNHYTDMMIGRLNAQAAKGLIKPPPGWRKGAGPEFWLPSSYGNRL